MNYLRLRLRLAGFQRPLRLWHHHCDDAYCVSCRHGILQISYFYDDQ
jgi:hypothetical protein